MIYKLKENRVFRTYFGGKRLDRFLGKTTEESGNFPEDWTASFTKAFNPGREEITEGYGSTENGELLRELSSLAPRCLVKLLDAEERLVIQVHPTREFAKEHFHSAYGKTECWYFLDCDADACVYLGFREGITPEQWREVFDRQDIPKMLSLLHRIPVQRGDCIFVDGGVPHAIGKGCFMIEVQEPTDLMGVTERQTPSGRAIPEIKLHGGIGIDEMMEMFCYQGYSKKEIIQRHFMNVGSADQAVRELVNASRTDKFVITELNAEASVTPSFGAGVVIVTEGEGELNGLAVHVGDRLFYCNEECLHLTSNRACKAVVCD